MRHFFGYQADGSIAYTAAHPGGFPVDCDLTDRSSQHPIAVACTQHLSNWPNIIGVLPYDCSCPSNKNNCSCASQRNRDSYVCDSRLVTKPELRLFLDNIEVKAGSTTNRSPGTEVILNLKSPSVPDGETALLWGLGAVAVYPTSPLPTVIDFKNGESSGVVITAPSQGLTGHLRVFGKLVRWTELSLRGF